VAGGAGLQSQRPASAYVEQPSRVTAERAMRAELASRMLAAMALRRALELLQAGEQINDRLYRSTVAAHPPVEARRWSNAGTRWREARLRRPRPGWSPSFRTVKGAAI
jgi:hypothetical protein